MAKLLLSQKEIKAQAIQVSQFLAKTSRRFPANHHTFPLSCPSLTRSVPRAGGSAGDDLASISSLAFSGFSTWLCQSLNRDAVDQRTHSLDSDVVLLRQSFEWFQSFMNQHGVEAFKMFQRCRVAHVACHVQLACRHCVQIWNKCRSPLWLRSIF